jgi:hypothetical protein
MVTTSGDCPSGVSRLKLPSGPLNFPWKSLGLVPSQATHYGACLRTAKVAEFGSRLRTEICSLMIARIGLGTSNLRKRGGGCLGSDAEAKVMCSRFPSDGFGHHQTGRFRRSRVLCGQALL